MRQQNRVTFFVHGRAERVRLEKKGPESTLGRWSFLPETATAKPAGSKRRWHRRSQVARTRRAKKKRLESLREHRG